MSRPKRSTTSLLLADWLRWRWQTIRKTPWLLMRVARRFLIRSFSTRERLEEFSRSNNRVIRVETLLTFCPPGPLLREAVKRSSSSGMETR